MARSSSPEHLTETCITNLSGTLAEQIQRLASELQQAARAERDAALAEARAVADAEMKRLQTAEAQRAAEAEAGAQRAIEQLRRELSESHARELTRIQQEFEATLVAQITEVLAEASKGHVAELARVRAQTAQAVAIETGKARAAAEREFAAELERFKTEAEGTMAERIAAAVSEAQERPSRRDRRATSAAPEPPSRDRQKPVFLGIALARGVRALEEALSASAVLDTLGRVIAAEAGRTAILVLRGVDAEIWAVMGFGDTLDCRRRPLEAHEIDASGPGAIASAIDRGEPCYARKSASGGPDRSGLRFAQLPEGKVGLAVPLQVNGQVVGVVYADDVVEDGRTVTAAWPEFVEVLVRYAARCLEALSRSAVRPGPLIPALAPAQSSAHR